MAPAAKRLRSFVSRLPAELAQMSEAVLAEVDDLDSEASPPPSERRRRFYEVSRRLERALWTVEDCPLPEVGWMQPGRVFSLRTREPVRIQFVVNESLVDRLFFRFDGFQVDRQRRLDWFWARSADHAPPEPAPLRRDRSMDADWDSYELIREELE